ncbi:SRPBCC family protein [Streptomyces nogalater]
MPDASDSPPDIHWPSGFSPEQAHGFCQVQAVVHAPPATAFALLADVPRWPEWVPGITEAWAGALARTYEVLFHGQRFEVFVGEQVAPRRLGWSGVGAGVQVYQAWLLTAVAAAPTRCARTWSAVLPRRPSPRCPPPGSST